MIILKKVIINLLILFILLCCLISLTTCKNYEPKKYRSEEEIQQVFYQNEELFNDFANTLIKNTDYKNEYEQYAPHYSIKPNDKLTKKYFNHDEQKMIKEFFNLTRPYSAGISHDRYLWIEYDSHEGNGWFPVRYAFIYYFDKISESEYEPGKTYYECDLQYKNWVHLTPDWMFWTHNY